MAWRFGVRSCDRDVTRRFEPIGERSDALTQLVRDHQHILARGFTPLAELSTSTP